MELKKQKIK